MRHFFSIVKNNLPLTIILLVGFILRLTAANIHSYSSDELRAIIRLDFNNVRDFFEYGVKTGDMHPAGVQVFEKLWSICFGTSEFAMRLPFVVAGTLSIYILYKIGKLSFSKEVGLMSALLLSILFFPILQSELARPYSPGLLFTSLTAFYILKLHSADVEKPIRIAIFLGLSFAGAMYTHYFAFLTVGLMGISSLFYIPKPKLKFLVLSGAIATILFLPHLPITLYHLNVEGGIQWLAAPGKTWLLEFLFFAFNSSWLLILSLLVVLVLSLFNKQQKTKPNLRIKLLLASWFFGIYIVGVLFSKYSSPILKFPVMLFSFPFFLILVSTAFHRVKSQIFNWVFTIIAITGVSTTIFEKKLYSNTHFGLIKELALPISDWQKQYGKNNTLTILNVSSMAYLNFYSKNNPITAEVNLIEYGDENYIYQLAKKSNTDYCIIGFSSRNTLVQNFENCLQFYPNIIEHKTYFNSSLFLLSKTEASTYLMDSKLLSSFSEDKNDSSWDYQSQNLQPDHYLSDSSALFGPNYHFKLKDIGFKSVLDFNSKYYLKVSIHAESADQTQGTITLSATRQNEPIKTKTNQNVWLGQNIDPMQDTQQKFNSFFATNLPLEIEPDDFISIGFWNRNGQPIKIFDIKIELKENIWNPSK